MLTCVLLPGSLVSVDTIDDVILIERIDIPTLSLTHGRKDSKVHSSSIALMVEGSVMCVLFIFVWVLGRHKVYHLGLK